MPDNLLKIIPAFIFTLTFLIFDTHWFHSLTLAFVLSKNKAISYWSNSRENTKTKFKEQSI